MHAKAAVARWDEELRLLCEEARRIVQSFRKEEEEWARRAGEDILDQHGHAAAGFRAYAHKRAALFKRLGNNAAEYHSYYAMLPRN